MEYLRTEVREFHRFFVGHLRHHEGRLDGPGIRTQNPINIRPDFNHSYFQRSPDDRRRIVRAVASDRCRASILGGTDESGHHRKHASAVPGIETGKDLLDGSLGFAEDHTSVREAVVGHNDSARVHEPGRARPVEKGCERQSREPLAETCRKILCPGRTVTEKENSL